jgi:NAD(P)-dependent dehydrogenase (short-subunit alcohol dehydrogenase family)
MNKKVILITGTSRGIGKATAEYLKSKGYIVYGSSRGVANISINQLQLEVTDFESCKNAVEEVVKKEGRLDVLINSAAYELVGAHEEYTVEEIRAQVEVNFFGALHMMKATTPQMLKQKSGNIINISSVVLILVGLSMGHIVLGNLQCMAIRKQLEENFCLWESMFP